MHFPTNSEMFGIAGGWKLENRSPSPVASHSFRSFLTFSTNSPLSDFNCLSNPFASAVSFIVEEEGMLAVDAVLGLNRLVAGVGERTNGVVAWLADDKYDSTVELCTRRLVAEEDEEEVAADDKDEEIGAVDMVLER